MFLGNFPELLCFLHRSLFTKLFTFLAFVCFLLSRKSLPAETQLCRAAPCPAVLCGAVWCCVVCCVYFFVNTRYHMYEVPSGIGTPVMCAYYNKSRNIHSQLSSTQLPQQLSAAPCGAVPCGAVLCPAVWCCAVLCRAALCSLSYIQQYQVSRSCEVPGTKYRYVRVCLCFTL